jgi:hypothetical protein
LPAMTAPIPRPGTWPSSTAWKGRVGARSGTPPRCCPRGRWRDLRLRERRLRSANSLPFERIPSAFHVITWRIIFSHLPGLPDGRSEVLMPFFEVYCCCGSLSLSMVSSNMAIASSGVRAVRTTTRGTWAGAGAGAGAGSTRCGATCAGARRGGIVGPSTTWL